MYGLLAAITFIKIRMGMGMGMETKRVEMGCMGMGTGCVGMGWRWGCQFIPVSLFSIELMVNMSICSDLVAILNARLLLAAIIHVRRITVRHHIVYGTAVGLRNRCLFMSGS